jgi:hypothetical protein
VYLIFRFLSVARFLSVLLTLPSCIRFKTVISSFSIYVWTLTLCLPLPGLRQPDDLEADYTAWTWWLLIPRVFLYTCLNNGELTENKRSCDSLMLDKVLLHMSVWNQSAPFTFDNTHFQHLITEHSCTQNTGKLKCDVLCGRHKAVAVRISYCFVVPFQSLQKYGLISLHLYIGNSIISHIFECRFHFFLSSCRHLTCFRVCSFHSLSLVSSAERQPPFERGGCDVATLQANGDDALRYTKLNTIGPETQLLASLLAITMLHSVCVRVCALS